MLISHEKQLECWFHVKAWLQRCWFHLSIDPHAVHNRLLQALGSVPLLTLSPLTKIGITCTQVLQQKKIFPMKPRSEWLAQWNLKYALKFLSIFVHISGFMEPIILIWVSLERSFPPAELGFRWCQVWSKMMTSEVEQRSTLLTTGYGWHGSQ